MAVVFVEIGQEVHITDGGLEDAINEGVRQGYVEGYLRKSVVSDPIERVNTQDNTPAIIHYSIVPGDRFRITLAPKGFGSENMSQIRMFKPSAGLQGIKDFILEVVETAGPNPCPPMVVGVGIGGTFDKCALLAKKALMRPLNSFAARQMAETAMDAFLLPRCSKRFPQEIGKGRPCLNAHIGKCMAVCSGKISCETYNQAVKNAVHLIRYGKKDILKTLNERMQEASDRLEFETAALLRDQINAITKLTAGQKVVVDPDVEMDVVALAGTPDSVCAAVLRFREGRLTDKREFLFHDTSDIDAVREEFLPRYYLDDEQIPKIIAVDALPPDMNALQQALNQKRGSEVQLYVPQRGDKAHLVEMAHTNAVERLARESGRYAREEKLLDELAQVLGLSKPPRAIESYDISNWGDGSSVCGMVTFKDGKPFKAGYRKFKMKTVAGTDDYASLAETVSRRAAEYEKYAAQAENGQPSGNWFGQKPDLLLMDGGRGQVSAAKEALAGTALADVPLYGMVKDDHHRTRAIVDSDGREIAINMNRGTFTFITAIQDETHRFANAYRKQQMRQKSYSSTLTEVPGVGPKTAKALLTQFKSVGAVKEATPDQLENTPGVGRQLAQTIYEYFHQA